MYFFRCEEEQQKQTYFRVYNNSKFEVTSSESRVVVNKRGKAMDASLPISSPAGLFILAHQVCAVSSLPSAAAARQAVLLFRITEGSPSLSQAAFSNTLALSRARVTGDFEALLLF